MKRARPPLVRDPKGCTGGRSGLHRAAQQLTAVHREVRIRATETSQGGARPALGETGNLCAQQHQIGQRRCGSAELAGRWHRAVQRCTAQRNGGHGGSLARACRRTESGLSARFTLSCRGGACARGDPNRKADESRRKLPLARTALGPGRPAGLPGHARPVLDRHLPAGLLGHCGVDRRDTGADAADAVGLPVRLRGDEPVPWRAVRQLRPPAGRAVGHRAVHASPRPAARSPTASARWSSGARCRACRPGPASWCRGR